MSDENVAGVVTSIINEPSPDRITTTDVNSDHIPSACSSTVLPKISSGELEVNVFCWIKI
jgi:hypothetical protein